MWILLEPEDVLLFRDSRPFTAGEDFRAQGSFPPLPNAVAGALRSSLLQTELRSRDKTFAEYNQGDPALSDLIAGFGDANTLGNLSLAGPLVCRFYPETYAVQLLFTLPADLLGNRALRPQEMPLPGWRTSIPGLNTQGQMPMATAAVLQDAILSEIETPPEADVSDWLDERAMNTYLCGEPTIRREPSSTTPVTAETLTGIELKEETRTAQQGMFYSIDVQRPRWHPQEAVGLLINAKLPSCSAFTDGYLPLGGEGRSIYARLLSAYAPLFDTVVWREEIAHRIMEDGGRFRLYLATPAVFAQGLLPEQVSSAAREYDLIGAAAGKPLLVGGWNMASGAPRTLRRAVPAGAVYYGRLKERTLERAQALVQCYHLRTTLQASDSLHTVTVPNEAVYRAQMGYGLTLVGAWTHP